MARDAAPANQGYPSWIWHARHPAAPKTQDSPLGCRPAELPQQFGPYERRASCKGRVGQVGCTEGNACLALWGFRLAQATVP